MTEFKFRLDEVLKELSMSQADLSRLTGLSKPAIVNLVHNPVAIQFKTLELICQATKKTPNDLFYKTDK